MRIQSPPSLIDINPFLEGHGKLHPKIPMAPWRWQSGRGAQRRDRDTIIWWFQTLSVLRLATDLVWVRSRRQTKRRILVYLSR
jgi:hypothetical protein